MTTVVKISGLALLLAALGMGLALAADPLAGSAPGGRVAAAPLPTEKPRSPFVPGEVLVKFKADDVSAIALNSLLAVHHAQVQDRIEDLGVARLKVPVGQEQATIAALQSSPLVEYAEPNHFVYAQATPNDPDFGLQWGLTNINAPQAWDVITGSQSITVAVVDSGLDHTHSDLAAKAEPGYDIINNDPEAEDECGHGTHVAGIIGAATNNGLGVAGLSWGARLMPLKVLKMQTGGCRGEYYDLANGIVYAANHQVPIINMSLGGDDDDATLREAVEYAYGKGCLMMAAAGNDGTTAPFYPAAYDEVMGVAATTALDDWGGYNHGSYVAVSAPGRNIYSTVPGGYGYKSGTSEATPHVAGLAALIWSLHPTYTVNQVRTHIEQSTVDLGDSGWDEYFGHGRIDACGAVQPSTLTSSPGQVTFLIDSTDTTTSSHQTLNVVGSGCDLSWQASVSPSSAVSWLNLSSSSGVVTSSSPETIDLSVTRPVTYGTYTASVVIDSPMRYVQFGSRTTAVTLVYTPGLYSIFLPIAVKNQTFLSQNSD